MTDDARSRFQVVAQLAAGSTTNVYLCRLQGVAGFVKELAVKRLAMAPAGDPRQPERARQLMDEGWIAAQLNHANIVQVFEVGEDSGSPYIAMEYVRGVTLANVTARMAGLSRLDLGLGVQLVTGIAGAVAYTHQASDARGQPLGLIHRDVSPANVIVSLGGMPKLLDFGLARARQRLSPTEAAAVFKGDLRYVAPEQIAHRAAGVEPPVDQRADVFSLGVMLYELTTARNPFGPAGQSIADVQERIVSGGYQAPSTLLPGYPPELEHIVLSAMEPDLNRRCESARLFFERLEALAAAHGDVANPPAWAAWLRELFPELLTTPRPQVGAGANLWRTPTPGRPVAAGPAPSFARLAVQRTESNRSVPATVPPDPADPADPALGAPATRTRPLTWVLACAGLVAAGIVVGVGHSRGMLTGADGGGEASVPPPEQLVLPAPADPVVAPAVDAGTPAVDASAPPAPIVVPDNDVGERPARRPARRSRSRKAEPIGDKLPPS